MVYLIYILATSTRFVWSVSFPVWIPKEVVDGKVLLDCQVECFKQVHINIREMSWVKRRGGGRVTFLCQPPFSFSYAMVRWIEFSYWRVFLRASLNWRSDLQKGQNLLHTEWSNLVFFCRQLPCWRFQVHRKIYYCQG